MIRPTLLARTFLLLLMLLSSGMAEAFTKTSLSYIVDRVWFDADSIYIIYEKEKVTSHYSLSDIHGTVLREESELFLSRLPREAGEGVKVFSLENREDATSIIYRDKEFDISFVGEKVKLVGSKKSVTLPKCSMPVWTKQGGARQDVIRVRNRLLYCGLLFDPSGDLVLEIPKSVTSVIEREHQDHPSLFNPLQIIPAISNGNLLTVRVDPDGANAEMKIGVWPLSTDKKMKWLNHILPPSPGGYEIDTYRSYSPASFVLRPVASEDKSILLCNETRCERINLHDKYSIVIVDEEEGQLIEIMSGIRMLTPSVTIYTSAIR